MKFYYEWSPEIVEIMNEDAEFRREVEEMIDGVVKGIQ